LWNANNTMGFERIDWPRLNFVATLTTVSRYMKHLMRGYGVDPLIIPNGIPAEILQQVPQSAVSQVRGRLAGDHSLLLFKVGRYDPAKCWLSSIEAAAQLKQEGETVRFLCRGGIESHGGEVLSRARELGLLVKDVDGRPQSWQEALEAIDSVGTADVYNLRFGMSQATLQVFYAAADFVVANSKHEPFGLVGLEAMAAGGVVFTGPTGETYSADGAGAIALDTEQPGELVQAIQNLREHPERAQVIRQVAPCVAAHYTWENVLEILFEKIGLAASHQKIQPLPVSLAELSELVQQGIPTPLAKPDLDRELAVWPAPIHTSRIEIPASALI
jgi:glycosyltransferase involved in cell wall biosynthesis